MEELSLKEIQNEWHGSARSYVIGFFSSLVLTVSSFSLVVAEVLPVHMTAYSIATLAVVQATLQLRYFLHVGQEPKPRWETVGFFSMLTVLLIIAIGTLWIMHDLNSRVMKGMEIKHD